METRDHPPFLSSTAMGKRKKSSRKPAGPRKKEPLDTQFTCIFCNHDNSVTVRMNRKEGMAYLACRVCDQKFQSKATHLTEPVDVYSEWIDAADAAQKEESSSRAGASSSRQHRAAPASVASDTE